MNQLVVFALTLALLLALSGCAGPASPSAPSSLPAFSSSASQSGAPQSPASSGGQPGASALPACFDASAFSGKVRQAAYAGKATVLVLADELCLYDTQTGNVAASSPCPLDSLARLVPFAGGYAAIGRQVGRAESGGLDAKGDNRLLCILYDEALRETKRLELNDMLPAGSYVISEDCVALSPDGAKLAAATLDGLYLCDIGSGDVTPLVDFASPAPMNGLLLVGIQQLDFVAGGAKIAFLGSSLPAAGQADEFSVNTYGTLNPDGSELENLYRQGYAVGEELLARNDLLALPEDFTKTEGRLLCRAVGSGEETLLSFTTPGEGRDGVYLSQQGEYFATAALGEGLTIRVYERATGRFVQEQTIANADPLYFARIPRVLLLDDSRTCIVLLATRQAELQTLAACFSF